MPYHRARDWVRELASDPRTLVRGMYMAFTESDFDAEQLNRFDGLISDAREDAIDLGRLHAASSNGVFHLPEAHLDMVRPGIALYGSYPSRPDEERAMSELRPACRLKARVVRVARLRPGDSVSYGRSYVAERAVWTATIPAGHTDGVTRNAVDGARVLIGERTYPVIGAVSASHCIVEIGAAENVGGDSPVRVGDVATLLGPDHPDVDPNELARVTETSVYDRLMHLSPSLPRVVV